MTIHATAITIHGCKVHLEPTGPEPSIPEQRYRFQAEHVASTEAILGSAIRGWVQGQQIASATTKPCRYITSARVNSGQVEIVADSNAARAEARAILEGHKANLDRIAVLDEVRNETACMGPPGVFYHDEADAVRALKGQLETARAEVRRLTDERAKLMTERDEARQMHKERIYYDRTHLEQENTALAALADLQRQVLLARLALDPDSTRIGETA